MSIDEIRRKARKFQQKIGRRNLREYIAALVVVVFFSYTLWHDPDTVTRVGFAMIIAGMLYIVYQLHHRGSARSPAAEMGSASWLEFHRRELERQRDLVGSVWSWYLGPMIPGWVVLTVGLARTNPGHLQHVGVSLAVLNLVAALVFVGIWKLNQRAARRLQRRIDELDALQKQE
ncbi:MAG TPA: hypothetical protein VKM93_07005 [Terriglobia bacterium]|nr:hypothetical protein [Terriglobia bacterium]